MKREALVLAGSLLSGFEGGQFTDSLSVIPDTSGNSPERCLWKATVVPSGATKAVAQHPQNRSLA